MNTGFLATVRRRLLGVGMVVALALSISACGGGGGGGGEGKGYPGDTDYSKNVIKPYYVNNNLIDPPVDPTIPLPPSWSNENELTGLPVADQGPVGSCAAVSFAQTVYAADAAAGAATPVLDNVQYSYLFARYYLSQTGGDKGFKADSGSYFYTNFRALTNADYFTEFTNGHLPLDGPHDQFKHATGVFFPPFHGPSIEDDPNGYWNDMNIWKDLQTGPTDFSLVIRTSGFTASSLDVKARLAAGNVVLFAMQTNDKEDQFNGNLRANGVLKLPFEKGKGGGGHAMIIVGYDDAGYGKYQGAGAFKVRNSWGADWGDQGYWYLPYSLVDGESGSGAEGDWPIYQDENYVYISEITHN